MINIFIIITLIILSGIFKGFMDALRFHYSQSFFINFKNEQFWNPNISWLNKYNSVLYNDGIKFPKFFGSTTFFVWLTDGWHLLQMIYLNLLFLAMGMAFTNRFILITNDFYSIIIMTLIFSVLFKTAFEVSYNLSYKK